MFQFLFEVIEPEEKGIAPCAKRTPRDRELRQRGMGGASPSMVVWPGRMLALHRAFTALLCVQMTLTWTWAKLSILPQCPPTCRRTQQPPARDFRCRLLALFHLVGGSSQRPNSVLPMYQGVALSLTEDRRVFSFPLSSHFFQKGLERLRRADQTGREVCR